MSFDRFIESIRLVERAEPEGKVWTIVIIESGFSKNKVRIKSADGSTVIVPRYYPPEVLKEAVPLFEGARVNAFNTGSFDHLSDEDRAKRPQGNAGNLVGWIKNVRFGEADGVPALLGDLYVSETALWLRTLLKEAFDQKQNPLGFSIDVQGSARPSVHNGQKILRIDAITEVTSVDVVTHPAAGGRAHRLVASMGETMKLRENIAAMLKKMREDKEMSVADLAAAAGVPEEQIVKYEAGEEPSEENLAKLAKALGVSIDSFQMEESKVTTAMDTLAEIATAFPEWVKGFATKGFSEAKAAETLRRVIEANRELANKELASLDLGDVAAMTDVARGVATLTKLSESFAEKRFDEGVQLVRDWSKNLPERGQEKHKYSLPLKEQKEPLKEATKPPEAKAMPEDDKEKKVDAALQRLELAESRLSLREKLSGIEGLPQPCIDRIRESFTDRVFDESELDAEIKAQRDLVADLSKTGNVVGCGTLREELDATVVEDQLDKYGKAMDGMLGQKPVDGVAPFISLHESYRAITGHSDTPEAMGRMIMRGMLQAVPGAPGIDPAEHFETLKEAAHAAPVRLREATLQLSTWTQIFGDSITRRMIREFESADLQTWRQIVSDIVPLKDFRTQRRVRVGGFGALSIVSELGTYPELTLPADEEETYSAQKRGGLVPVSMESIINDDLGVIRRIPKELGLTAGISISEFVFNTMLFDNPTMADGNAVVSGAHNNDQTVALTDASLTTAYNQMRKQTRLSSGKRIAVIPKTLVVPIDLKKTAFELLESSVKVGSTERETIINFVGKLGLTHVENPWTTDLNDWFLLGDKRFPGIEIGFLGGRQAPEIFIQDQPAIGSVLTADKITYKVRYVFGGVPQDFRAVAGSIVA